MKTLRDTWLVFQRAMGQTLHTPMLIVVSLAQPLIFLFLFGPLLKNSLRGVSSDQVFNLYIPGLMVQLALFGALFACFSLTGELSHGVIERFQVTPISRFPHCCSGAPCGTCWSWSSRPCSSPFRRS